MDIFFIRKAVHNYSAMVSVWSDFWICEANQGKRETETGAFQEDK
jgi:hypothetical protein